MPTPNKQSLSYHHKERYELQLNEPCQRILYWFNLILRRLVKTQRKIYETLKKDMVFAILLIAIRKYERNL